MTLMNHLTPVPPDLERERDDDEASPQITVRLPLRLANHCAVRARKEGIDLNQFVRRIVRAGLASEAQKGE